MPIDLIATAFDQILELAKEKGKRNDKILKALNAIGIKQDAPPANDFDGVYAYTLVIYGVDKPKPILEFFCHQFIKSAFRQSFETRDNSYLEEESKNFLDWSPIAKEILSTYRYDPRQEFAEFRKQFITAAKLSRTVQEVLVEHRLDDIQESLDLIPNIEDFRQELQPIAEGIEKIRLEKRKQNHITPFILPQLNITNFVSRDEELSKLENQIFQENESRIAGIVGVTGTGGMGKSALAFHFAHKYKDNFPDGVIGLRIDSESVDAIAQRFASLAGADIDPQKGMGAAEIMQSVFRPLRALLIFDNVEAATAKALRPGGNKCAVIVTTRNKALLRNLDIPDTAHIDLRRFSYAETRELLELMIGSERVQAEEEAIKEIHEIVGGLPLALRIVGGALGDQPFTPIRDYVNDLRRAKLDLLQDVDDAELDVRATFSLSLRFLTYSQIDLFATLSACALEGFSFQTIHAVSVLALDDLRQGLARLVKLSLVNESGQSERFVLHPLLFDFAEEIAKERGIYQSAQERHFRYFLDFAIRHRDLSFDNINIIEDELDNLILTANRLVEFEVFDYEFFFLLERFFQFRGYWTQALDLINKYQKLAIKINNGQILISMLIQQGKFLQIVGNFNDAERALREAEDKITSIRDEQDANRLHAMLLTSLGGVLQRQGKFDEAIRIFQRSLDIETLLEDERGKAIVLNSLGTVLQKQNKLDQAIDAFQRSAKIGEKLKDYKHLAIVLNSIGVLYQRQSKFDKAVNAFQRSYEIETQLGDDRGQSMVLNSLGGVYQRQGKYDEAADIFRKSYLISERLEDDRSLAMVLNSLGGVLQRQGKYDEAVDAFQRSASIGEKLKDYRHLAMILHSLGIVFLRQGKFDEAVESIKNSFELLVSLDDNRGQAMTLNSLGGIYKRQTKYDEAIDALQKALEITKKINDEVSLAMVMNSIGGVLQNQGKLDDAEFFFQSSYKLLIKLGDTHGQAKVLNSLGGVLQRQSKYNEAFDAYQQSYSTLMILGDERGQAMILNSLGGVLYKQGNYKDSEKAYIESINIGERLMDFSHLAKVHTAFGKSLLGQNKLAAACEELQKGFDLAEQLQDKFGIRMVLPPLINVLTFLERKEDAAKVCNRALIIAPKDEQILKTRTRILEKNKLSQKQGFIKKIIKHKKGYLYGFIKTNDGSPDVYFNERQVDRNLLTKLEEGLNVFVELVVADKGPYALRIWNASDNEMQK